MPWVKLDDGFTQHPKVATAGPLAMAMQVAALGYCNRELTDGFVPRAVARTLLDFEIERDGRLYTLCAACGASGQDITAAWVIDGLIAAGMWEEVPGGYRIHDYHDYQPTREEVLDVRGKRAESGRLGGLQRAASRQANAKQTASKVLSKSLAKVKPVPVPVPERENDSLSCEIGGAGSTIAADFDTRFWQRYPKGRGVKKQALAQWQRLKSEERDAAALGLDKWLACEQWQDPRFVVHAERWLRDRRWEDEPPPTGRGNGYRSQADINSGGAGRLVL